MLALFNAVPKKKEEVNTVDEELDPDAGPTFTDITQEIEYQRANVVAKTKITDEVFQCAFPLACARSCVQYIGTYGQQPASRVVPQGQEVGLQTGLLGLDAYGQWAMHTAH
jgi:hypothetical protein